MKRRWLPLAPGFGLVEMLIALLLGLLLVLAVVQVFLSSQQSFRVQQRLSGMQEDARFVLQRLAAEIRMTGMYGCLDLAALPADIQALLPPRLAQPLSYTDGVLTLITASQNHEVFSATTTRHAGDYGARWLLATNCRDQLRLDTDGEIDLQPGDILIPLQQLEYRWQPYRLQVRTNAAGNFDSVIEGVAGFTVSFALATDLSASGVTGEYVNQPSAESLARIRSVRLSLQLSDAPADSSQALLASRQFSLVAGLRNRSF